MNKPARKITNTGGNKIIGHFMSIKCSRPVTWESQLERDYAYYLEFDSDVVAFESQPFTVEFRDDIGKRHTYTPDFLVQRKNGVEVIEVKPEDKLEKERNKMIIALMPGLFREEGKTFRVVTDKMIRVFPLLDNIKLLCRYRNISVNTIDIARCLECLKDTSNPTIREAANLLEKMGKGIETVYYLIFHGYLAVDMMKAVNSASSVMLTHNYKNNGGEVA